MGRRKDHSREELEELVINAAEELVHDKGFSDLTARNIATKIGYTPGTLYNIFANLDEIIARVNERTLIALADKFSIIQQNKIPDAQLWALSKVYIEFYEKEPHLWELLFAYPISEKPEWYQQSIAATFNQIADIFKNLGKTPTQARQEAKLFWASLHGLCSLHHVGKLDIGKTDSLELLNKKLLNRYL